MTPTPLDPIQNVLLYFFERLVRWPNELACRSLAIDRIFAESSKRRTAVADIRTGTGIAAVLPVLLDPLSPPPLTQDNLSPLQLALLKCWPQP